MNPRNSRTVLFNQKKQNCLEEHPMNSGPASIREFTKGKCSNARDLSSVDTTRGPGKACIKGFT